VSWPPIQSTDTAPVHSSCRQVGNQTVRWHSCSPWKLRRARRPAGLVLADEWKEGALDELVGSPPLEDLVHQKIVKGR
jgi:hypothetical protein